MDEQSRIINFQTNKRIKKIVIKSILFYTGTPVLLFGGIEVINYIFKAEILKGSKVIGVLIFLLIGLFITTIRMSLQLIEIIKEYEKEFFQQKATNNKFEELKENYNKMEKDYIDLQNKVKELQNNNSSFGLYESVKMAHEKQNWKEVIHIGKELSRALWIAGLYNTRIEIGGLVENAAAMCGDKKTQSETLIDDLGWTLIACNKLQEGEKNIKHGLRIAEDNHFYCEIYKATRHLSGIQMNKNRFDDAENNLKKAEKAIEKMDESTKEQYMAQLQYARASLMFKQGKYDDAIEECSKAKNCLQDKDIFREVKTYNLLGRAFFEKGEMDVAKDWFRQGIEECKINGRKDQLMRNYCGLMSVCKSTNDDKERKKIYEEANEVANSLKNEKFIEMINAAYNENK